MLLSLLVYSLTGFTLFFLGWHVNKREQQSLLNGGAKLPFYSWEIFLSLLVFSVVAGARYHTGYDHAMYLEQYQHLQETGDFSRHNFEYGFEWISRLFAWCNIHYFFYFAFWALLQIGFLYFGLRNHKHLLCWVGLVIMLGPYFVSWMNSVRQSVVVCIFVTLVSFIKERDLKKNVLVILVMLCVVILAAFIHKSALLMIPVLLILFLINVLRVDKNAPNRWVMLSIFAFFVLLGNYPFWIDYFSNYQWFLDITGYQNYANLDDPNVAGQFRTINWGPLHVLLLLSNVALIWFYPELKKFFKDDTLLPYFFLMAFVGLCLTNLLMNTTHFILRPVEYFNIFVVIITAYLLCYLYKTKNVIMFILVSILSFGYIYIAVVKAFYYPTRTSVPFLYHLFFCPSL